MVQVHAPPTHAAPLPLQVFPHIPQFSREVWRLTHAPLQSTRPVPHIPHVPLMQF
jgi:hypothetical protein